MSVVGLIFSIVFFAVEIIEIALFLALTIVKNYFKADKFLAFIFLSSLVSIMFLSWSLVMINKGSFEIYFNIDVNFTKTLIIIIPVAIFLLLADFAVRRNIKSKNAINKFARYIEPVLIIIIFAIITIIFYFNCNYFEFIKILSV